MTILYQTTIITKNKFDLESDLKPTLSELYSKMFEAHRYYGIMKSKLRFVFISIEDGLYTVKIMHKNGKGRIIPVEISLSAFNQEEIINSIKDILNQFYNGIVVYVIDNNNTKYYQPIINEVRSTFKLKRKADLILQ